MDTLLDQTARLFTGRAPAVDAWSLRLVTERRESLTVRQDVMQPPETAITRGAFMTVLDAGGAGYAATSDLSPGGLVAAAERAKEWAALTAAPMR